MTNSGREAIHCGPCEYENVTKLATKWCSDCEEGYCDECLRLHKASKMSRHHHLVPVSEYQKVEQLSIPQVCHVHQKAFEYFCPGHDYVICILCVKSDHSKCPDPLSLQNAAKGTKTSTALSDLELSIDKLLENIKDGIKIQDKNLDSLSDSEQSINTAVKAKHEEMIQYFERLQEKTYMELKAKYGQCQQEISSSKNTFIKKQTQLQNMKDQILQMKKYLSDVQAFVGMKMMTQNINDEKQVVKSLVTDMSSLVLKFEPNRKIHTSIENIDTYGTTNTAISKHSATFVDPQVQQAQLKITPVKSVKSIQLELRTMIDLKCMHCEISSCLILPNKQIMILDRNKARLMIYNEIGSHDRNIAVFNNPFDATVIDRETVAVTSGNGCKFISIVDIKTNRIKRNIENAAKQWCWGISHDNGKLYVVSYDEGINVLDLSGCIIKNFRVDVSTVFKIVTASENVIYTDIYGNIFSLDTDGSQTVKFSCRKLENSCFSASITVDDKGNIYAVGERFNVCIAVSNDGETSNVLLTEKEGLINPNAVYLSEENKLLLICNKSNGSAALCDINL